MTNQLQERLEKLVVIVMQNSWRESRFLTPDPETHIAVCTLFDQILDVFPEISQDKISELVDKCEDERLGIK